MTDKQLLEHEPENEPWVSMHSAPVQEPDELQHIGEQDCLLDVDEKAWRSLVENRGGCRCHISPPCGACSEPISEEEMNEVGYTYTTPPAQPKPALVVYDGEIVKSNLPKGFTGMLYTTPPAAQRQWAGLTDELIADIQTAANLNWVNLNYIEHRNTFARAIEAKLKEKNNG